MRPPVFLDIYIISVALILTICNSDLSDRTVSGITLHLLSILLIIYSSGNLSAFYIWIPVALSSIFIKWYLFSKLNKLIFDIWFFSGLFLFFDCFSFKWILKKRSITQSKNQIKFLKSSLWSIVQELLYTFYDVWRQICVSKVPFVLCYLDKKNQSLKGLTT